MPVGRKYAQFRFTLFLTSGLTLCSCTLPDLQPFANATADLSAAVTASSKVVVVALEENQMPNEAKSYASAFQLRVKAMAAFVEYSDSLASIAAAGKKGKENAEKVANAFNGLLTQVGSFIPGAGVVSSGVVGVISEGYALIATVRAASSMKSAVETADPLVQRLAATIGDDLGDMKLIIERVAENNVQRIKTCLPPYEPTDCQNLGTTDATLKAYSDRAKAAEKELALIAKNGGTPSAAQISAASDWLSLTNKVAERQSTRLALLEDVKKQKRLRLTLLSDTQTSFKAWADLHSKLSTNLRDGTQPNTSNLIAAAKSLRSLIEKVQAL